MKYQWLLFDADNTLLDFSKASKDSLWRTFNEHDLECSETIYKKYNHVNHQVWDQFEREEISALELRRLRFSRFFEKMGIDHIDPLNFNQRYLENLVLTSELYEGAEHLLSEIKGTYRMSIVTNGLKEVQKPRLRRLNLMHYFDSVIVSDEIGVAKPHADYFNHVQNSISEPPLKKETLIIGDNLKSDIVGGINFGIKTCWISHGKENTTDIQPDYVINSVLDLHEVL